MISYSSANFDAVSAFADALLARGYTVWYDRHDLSSVDPDGYRAQISKAIDAAKAVIVVWSDTAAASEWVRAEAEHARRLRRLMQVMLAGTDHTRIPKPYGERHVFRVAELDEMERDLKKLEVYPRR
jgi:ABC-type branched-subunit amino acid transport system substrate-binding protein